MNCPEKIINISVKHANTETSDQIYSTELLIVLFLVTKLCQTFKLSAEEITAKWMTFAIKSTENVEMTDETLEEFERKV